MWQDARGASYDIWGADYDGATNTWATATLVSDDPAATAQMRPTVARSATEVATAWRDDRVTGGDIRSRRRVTTQGVDHFTYSYDGLNRLLSVAGPVAESFAFDGATNITSRTGPSATNSYDGANRQTSNGTQNFTWSAADRLIQRGSDTFVFDALGRLTSSTVAASTRSYVSNGDGLLSTAVGTSYLWDVGVAPGALLQAGTESVVDGLGALYAVRGDGSTYTFARDGLGSVRAELSGSGSATKSLRYAAYGAIVQTAGGLPTLLGFAGELSDGSGLVYLRARWYDPVVGRFLSRDPLAGNIRVPSTFNGFAYASGAPTDLIDPLGLDPHRSWAASAAFALAQVFADLDSPDDFTRNYAYATVIVGGFAIAGLGVAATGVSLESALSAWVVQRTAAAAAGSAYVIGETQALVNRAAQGIGGVTMPYVANPALREQMTQRVINAVMDRGALIVSIGQDPDRVKRSQYYLLELQAILQRGYTYVIDFIRR